MAEERKGKGEPPSPSLSPSPSPSIEPRPLTSAPTRNLPLVRPPILTPPPSTKGSQTSLSGARTMQNVRMPAQAVSVSDVPMPSAAEARVRAVLEELAKPGPATSFVDTTGVDEGERYLKTASVTMPPRMSEPESFAAPQPTSQPFTSPQPQSGRQSARPSGQSQASTAISLPAMPAQAEGDPFRVVLKVSSHQLPRETDPRLVLIHDPDSHRAACYRVLRHRLADSGDPRVIAVSSARAGEGKTTCAANLALALGECGRARVLLVEANLRAPSLAGLFGFRPPLCFAEQLDQHRESPEKPWSVVDVGPPGLHVAAVNPGTSRPLLDGLAFGIAIDMLRRAGYDYLVIDTPPVLDSADVNIVADFADGTLLTTWARKSSSRDLRRAVEQLSPTHLLGVTLLDA